MSITIFLSACTFHFSAQNQKTALHYASEGGHSDTVRVLLEGGADPVACDKVSSVYITLYTMLYMKRLDSALVVGDFFSDIAHTIHTNRIP